MKNGTILSFRNLTVAYSYGALPVLDRISAELPDREVTAVMGPSGCGKSTLLRALNHTLELTPGAGISSGSVLFRGIDIYAAGTDPRLVRKRIGIVQQKPLPFPMSIQENVLFGVRFHRGVKGRERGEVARSFLERVGLWGEVKDRLHSPANQLSIGQQQRMCIARTLANEPEAVLMDEPCSALDPASTAKIEELIRALKETLAIVIVTHNLAQARRVSSSCLFLLDGAIAERGPTEKVLSEPEHPRVRDIVAGREG